MRLEPCAYADLLRGPDFAKDTLACDQATHDEDHEEVLSAKIAIATTSWYGCVYLLNYVEAVIAGEASVKEEQ